MENNPDRIWNYEVLSKRPVEIYTTVYTDPEVDKAMKEEQRKKKNIQSANRGHLKGFESIKKQKH